MENSMPTPPYDEHGQRAHAVSRKSPSLSSVSLPAARAAKSGNGSSSNTASSVAGSSGHSHHHNSHRASKRASTAPSASHSHHSASSHHGSSAHSHGSPHHDSTDGRHKRVWKACERCRMKKTKCDGEFPCKRCKDDGLVCTAGTRKKTEYKQLPKGYAEVLENTQFALVATVHKLYAMVRAAQAWDLGEPELNERGQPVIHSIAAKLGCIRPNNDPDLPMGTTVFPEDEADLADLASQLEDQQKQREAEQAAQAAASAAQAQAEAQQAHAQQLHVQTAAVPAVMPGSAPATMLTTSSGIDMNGLGRFDRASSSEELDCLSDMDDYRKNVFGNGNSGSVNSSSTTMSPQSLSYTDFDVVSNQSEGFVAPSPTVPTTQFSNWMSQIDPSSQSLQQQRQQQSQVAEQLQQQTQMQQQQSQQQQKLQRLQQQRHHQKRQQQQQQQQQQNADMSQLSLSLPTTMSTPIVASPTSYFGIDMLRQGLYESNFGTIKPHVLSCPNPEVMLGTGDPMIYSGGYDDVLM